MFYKQLRNILNNLLEVLVSYSSRENQSLLKIIVLIAHEWTDKQGPKGSQQISSLKQLKRQKKT